MPGPAKSRRLTFGSALLLLGLFVGCTTAGPTAAPTPARVLIIGDSISVGYTPFVREQLQGVAEVVHNEGNAGHTGRGLERLDSWLEGGPWDVIHFNWGLWDLAYRPDGSKERGLDKVNGQQSWSLQEYSEHLGLLVARLEQTGAVLIWASTTPVPEGEPGRFAGDELRYNGAALGVMEGRDITVNDLHAFAQPRLSQLQRPANVHFTPEGSRALGDQVSRSIRAVLRRR